MSESLPCVLTCLAQKMNNFQALGSNIPFPYLFPKSHHNLAKVMIFTNYMYCCLNMLIFILVQNT